MFWTILEIKVEPIASRTSPEFYMDGDDALHAMSLGSAFHLIHIATASKIDVFPMTQSEFHRSEMFRSAGEDWIIPGEAVRLPVASAEDTILSKLIWDNKAARCPTASGVTCSALLQESEGIGNICAPGRRASELPICWSGYSARPARSTRSEAIMTPCELTFTRKPFSPSSRLCSA